MDKCPLGEEHRRLVKATAAGRALEHVSDLCLYHWSPTSRRKGIERRGFVPRSISLQGDWRPPYTCFSDDPILAWSLSGRIHTEISEWDLWMVYPNDVKQWEIIFDTYYSTGRHYIKEYRVYHRVFKRHVHYVASRVVKTDSVPGGR